MCTRTRLVPKTPEGDAGRVERKPYLEIGRVTFNLALTVLSFCLGPFSSSLKRSRLLPFSASGEGVGDSCTKHYLQYIVARCDGIGIQESLSISGTP